jgi:hypothetical protein
MLNNIATLIHLGVITECVPQGSAMGGIKSIYEHLPDSCRKLGGKIPVVP